MHLSPAFIAAACAVLLTITEAAPMHRNQGQGHQGNRGQAPHPHNTGGHPPAQAFYDAPLPPSPPRGDSIVTNAGLAPLRDLRPRPRPPLIERPTTGHDWNALAQSHARGQHVNEFGSPIAQPQHGHAAGTSGAAESIVHSRTESRSSTGSQIPQHPGVPRVNPIPGSSAVQGEHGHFDVAQKHLDYPSP